MASTKHAFFRFVFTCVYFARTRCVSMTTCAYLVPNILEAFYIEAATCSSVFTFYTFLIKINQERKVSVLFV